MKSDIEIAQSAELQPIVDIAEKVGIGFDDLELYGKYKAKVSFDTITKAQTQTPGKLVLVTAINPTAAGEGKSTVTIGLADALNQAGKQTMIAFVSRLLGQSWGSKVVQPAVAMPRSFQWKISTFTLLAICMRLRQPTTPYLL